MDLYINIPFESVELTSEAKTLVAKQNQSAVPRETLYETHVTLRYSKDNIKSLFSSKNGINLSTVLNRYQYQLLTPEDLFGIDYFHGNLKNSCLYLF